MSKKTKLTSVKVLEDLYNNFKIKTVNNHMTLQKLTNRTLYLFNNDEGFRDKLENESVLQITGSNF